MASDWTVSPDGKTFTFTLKDGLTWSDGQPVTVDDFSFAYENAVKDENNFVGLDDVQRIDTFETPDPKTIVVTLKELLARDIAISVASGIGPVPKHVWQGKSWNDPTLNPEILKPTVVLGPFTVRDWNAAEGATFNESPTTAVSQTSNGSCCARASSQPSHMSYSRVARRNGRQIFRHRNTPKQSRTRISRCTSGRLQTAATEALNST